MGNQGSRHSDLESPPLASGSPLKVPLLPADRVREPSGWAGLGTQGTRTHHMLSSVRSSRVRPKESTYLSTLRFLSVSWAELKLDTTRVAIPRHLRTEKQEAGEVPPAGSRPHLFHSPSRVCLSVCFSCFRPWKRLLPCRTSQGTSEDTRPPPFESRALRPVGTWKSYDNHVIASSGLRGLEAWGWATGLAQRHSKSSRQEPGLLQQNKRSKVT